MENPRLLLRVEVELGVLGMTESPVLAQPTTSLQGFKHHKSTVWIRLSVQTSLLSTLQAFDRRDTSPKSHEIIVSDPSPSKWAHVSPAWVFHGIPATK